VAYLYVFWTKPNFWFFLTMSRPSRYGPKPQSQTNTFDKNGPNGTDAAAAVGLNKARAQFNEPIVQLQAIFPDWKEEDLISVLEEVKGDVELAVARISEGAQISFFWMNCFFKNGG
jgi:CUE domain